MSNYNEINGLKVKVQSGDPSNPIDGQVWYNSTTKKLMCRNNSATLTITTS